MQEQLVLFETAKLAREKGFNGSVSSLFDKDGNELSIHYWDYSSMTDKLEATFEDLEDGEYLRPSQSLLARWLREVHNIDVYCIPWIYENKRVYDFFINYDGESRAYSSYEEALEVGLQETLKLIKNE